MIWIFFWGIVTGVGISFVGALFWANIREQIGERVQQKASAERLREAEDDFYIALREGITKQLNEGKQETE